eukprot:1242779-Prorocentrum_lima.AAC.1
MMNQEARPVVSSAMLSADVASPFPEVSQFRACSLLSPLEICTQCSAAQAISNGVHTHKGHIPTGHKIRVANRSISNTLAPDDCKDGRRSPEASQWTLSLLDAVHILLSSWFFPISIECYSFL